MEASILNVAVFGLELEIRAERGLLDCLEHRLPSSWQRCRPQRIDRRYDVVRPDDASCTWELRGDDAPLARSLDAAALCEHFESDLELFLAVHARTHAIVHAGVVGWHGRAIVIPGRSFSGKTSLTAALIRQGADYYSDEYAVIDPCGLVHPFPKPLAIRRDGGRTRCEPVTLGASIGGSCLPIELIVLTEYQADAVWAPRQMSRGYAALALLANAAAARHQPAFLLRTFSEAVRQATLLAGPRGEAADVASQLLHR